MRGPQFERDRWDFTVVEQLPRSVAPGVLVWDFTQIRNPRWRVVAKEYLTALCAPIMKKCVPCRAPIECPARCGPATTGFCKRCAGSTA